jgi:hypothetical protein
MKHAIVLLVLLTVSAIGQQEAPPSVQAQIGQTLKDCQTARAYLEKQLMNGLFRFMTAAQMENYAVAIANCVRVDKEGRDADQKLSFQLSKMVDMRLRMFVLRNNLWDKFLKWDSDPDNEASGFQQPAGPGRIVSEERTSWNGENGVATTIWLKRGTERLQGVKQVGIELPGVQVQTPGGMRYANVSDFATPVMKVDPQTVTIFFRMDETSQLVLGGVRQYLPEGTVTFVACGRDRSVYC